MDIYSAEVQVNKLLNYVKELSESKPRMYQKSKDRLKELANTCNQVIVVISEILQDEALINNTDTEEFGGSDTADFNSVLNSMENQIYELRKFLSTPSKKSIVDVSTTNEKKQALYDYKQVLCRMASTSMPTLEAENCSRLLWDWFSARFLQHSPTFRYNMINIPRWIRDIVIAYCYYKDNNNLVEFTTKFYIWINSLSENNYPVPSEIHHLDLDPTEYLTLTSVVMWDILLDFGLRDLCCKSSSEFYPSEDSVYSLVGSLNSSIMDPYKNYVYDQTILLDCNFTLEGGDIK